MTSHVSTAALCSQQQYKQNSHLNKIMLPIWLSSIKAEENPFLAQQMNGAQSFVYLKAGSICRTMSSTALAERQHRDHTGCKASVKSE